VGSGDVESFVRDGFVKLQDPSSWAEPVYWVGGMSQPPFAQAMNSLVVLQADSAGMSKAATAARPCSSCPPSKPSINGSPVHP
jgi:hypothetical protein